ncbi:MAG TPA: hypothetical protein VMT30_00585 [Candidatus Saccharimonadia bacterium]|nr:hypothetical protein [Candidatus Saccharimonadia bacterium]
MSSLVAFLADASTTITGGLDAACGDSCNKNTLSHAFLNISTALTFVIGSVSVIMIIVGGLRYVLSRGDAKQAEAGRNTVLYAVMGVAIAIVAYAIVAFVNGSIGR